MAGGPKPDWRLAALIKGTGYAGNVGVGWTKPNGTISLKLNAFVKLEGKEDLVLTLFPEKPAIVSPTPAPAPAPDSSSSPLDYDDDIPF